MFTLSNIFATTEDSIRDIREEFADTFGGRFVLILDLPDSLFHFVGERLRSLESLYLEKKVNADRRDIAHRRRGSASA